MRPRKIGNQEIAFAMEMRTERITWKAIARGLGCHPDTIRDAVRQAEIFGMHRDRERAAA